MMLVWKNYADMVTLTAATG